MTAGAVCGAVGTLAIIPLILAGFPAESWWGLSLMIAMMLGGAAGAIGAFAVLIPINAVARVVVGACLAGMIALLEASLLQAPSSPWEWIAAGGITLGVAVGGFLDLRKRRES
ncbi:hypothetical protein GCM10009857_09590 [Agromyces soli]